MTKRLTTCLALMGVLLLLAVAVGPALAASPSALLLTELVVTPTEGEFVEIHNPSPDAVDLSDVYLTDATFAGGGTFYYNIVTGSNAGGGGFSDFHARFPDGATIAPGEYQTIALAGSDDFLTEYGISPTYELFEDGVSADAVPDMREALPGSINDQGGLTNNGEVVILYYWDGTSDLVADIDYALWGDKDEAVDKTGVAIDGPDADAATSTYLPDTAIASQDVIAAGSHPIGRSFQRVDLTEGTETQTGGNGVAGSDETSENLSVTWSSDRIPTPGEPTPVAAALVINEIDYDQPGTDTAEFIEIRNNGPDAVSLDSWNLELINGSGGGASVYSTIFLPNVSLAAGDYFVVCADVANVPNCDVEASPASNLIQNGAPDAVALRFSGSLVDTVSYEGDTGAPYTEGSGVGLADDGSQAGMGISRCPDGSDADQNNVDFTFTSITPGAANACAPVTPVFGVCGDPATFIHDVQGSGTVSPLAGTPDVVVEAVVVGDFQDTSTELGGFFLQEEDADADGNATTSEGIFVFDNGFGTDVNVGDVVRVQGDVAEFFDLTELNNVSNLAVCSSGASVTPAMVTLPLSNVGDWEFTEGMLVHLPQTLYVSGNYTEGRFGEVDLSINGPLDNPTNVVAPGAPAVALQDLNDRSRIQIDDGSTVQNPLPLPPYLGLDDTLRTGDTIPDLTGVVNFSFGSYEIEPTQAVNFTRANPRPLTPPSVGGDVTVAAFNVLNYFTTIDTGASICGPLSNQDCRGADSASELTRQRDKIVSAISAINADVVGIMEIENAPDDTPVADLVGALNDAAGAGTYNYIATGPIGDDAIRVGILYQPASVTPVGDFAVLDSGVDSRFDSSKNRPALAQTFQDNATSGRFTVVVNHLKSKGSDCNDVGDPDTGDGQGNCNLTRIAAAQALADWILTDPTGSGDPDFLITGDLNSYALEDPITTLEAAGYTDLMKAFLGIGYGAGAYSYNFESQSGYLDHALVNPSLAAQVTGAAFWHINADEPAALDYNDFNQPALYNPDPYRSSDHDPVLVGLQIVVTPAELKTRARDDLAALLPTGDDKDDKRIDKAVESIADSLDPSLWVNDHALTDKGKKVFDEEKKAIKELGKVDTAPATVQAAIDSLVRADQILAQKALDLAITVGGDPKEIEKAQKEIDKAADELADGKFDKAVDHYKKVWEHAIKAVKVARFATFNASLNRNSAGELINDLSTPNDAQAQAVAEIIQRTRPDVLLINEFDFAPSGVAALLFQRNYLSVSQNGADPIEYPYWFVAPSNTGIPSGFDLDNNGSVGGPDDAFGFGFFPGQFGMVVYSRFPIDTHTVRTFQNFLWKDMPGALLPDDPDTPAPADWYSPAELDVFRLSSKSHWDVPIQIGKETVHFLVSHPTPPVFDGPEDRNGTRNHDEIRFWADYIEPGSSGYIYDDNGVFGGLQGGDRFVIAGDENADPVDGDSVPGAIQQLLDHPKINTKFTPSSPGGPEQAALQGGANSTHLGDPAFDTADFADTDPGNLRADYVLPRNNMKITDGAVFWPLSTDPLFSLVGTFPFPSSDHRLVWVDVEVK